MVDEKIIIRKGDNMKSLFCSEEAVLPRWMIQLYQKVNTDCIEQTYGDSKEYRELHSKCAELWLDYPVLNELMKEYHPIRLRKNEHWAFHEYMRLKKQMEDLERQEIYQCGYVHCYESLRKMGAIR